MTPRRALLAVAIAGVAIFALSFVNAWIVHAREVRGEGYRFVDIAVGAWANAGVPVLTAGVLLALLTGLAAAYALLRGGGLPGWALLLGSVAGLGLIASGALPVAQDGHASSVDLSPGPLLLIGLVLALIQVAGSLLLTGRVARVLIGAAVVAALAVSGGWAGRWWALQAAEGDGRHWSDGSYTREATDGEPTETLTIGDGRVTIGDRWSGTWEWSGWTVVITGDPACPAVRGTYHAHGEGEADLRFVKVVDPCADGARAADLETGIWAGDP